MRKLLKNHIVFIQKIGNQNYYIGYIRYSKGRDISKADIWKDAKNNLNTLCNKHLISEKEIKKGAHLELVRDFDSRKEALEEKEKLIKEIYLKYPTIYKHLYEYSDRVIKTKMPSTGPILQFNKNNELVREYDSLEDVWYSTGFSWGRIFHCLNGKCQKIGGFTWKYKYQRNES